MLLQTEQTPIRCKSAVGEIYGTLEPGAGDRNGLYSPPRIRPTPEPCPTPTCIQLRATALPMGVSPYPARNLSILDRSRFSTGNLAPARFFPDELTLGGMAIFVGLLLALCFLWLSSSSFSVALAGSILFALYSRRLSDYRPRRLRVANFRRGIQTHKLPKTRI